ncbi:calcium/sodium antiporter [Marinimicrobium sp. ABcell2]|uniref:calcium/sodium antiporter n=1 Tax=Marinimicrobium sp. ABcell2 TaxID=3069751 RepID=UPI0027B6C69F|nr:calcium/sodium antiporter [Marinimicrobium sp. ABcell2]MDQ2078268.1 calcium/sodium antiporter [Marinimicrobium sp. ABcell2]
MLLDLWLPLIAIAGGFVGLLWSADRFVAGSAALAYNLGVSKLVIGLTIVSFGTSAPEIVVSFSASFAQAGELAVGNALGSNLANMGLVLAVTALIAPLAIHRHLLRNEIPVLLLVTALAGVLLYDARLVFWEGLILLLALPLALGFLTWNRRQDRTEQTPDIPGLGNVAAGVWFLVGLAVLIAASEALVWGASELALSLGVTPLVVGLTVIAVGTSLPELAASVTSALKGHQDMAIGNIVGSNVFNLLAVMAIPALIPQAPMESAVFWRDFAAMGIMTAILAAALVLDYALRRRQGRVRQACLGRSIGVLLLLGYIGYYAWLMLG